jgi:hypothetical protein
MSFEHVEQASEKNSINNDFMLNFIKNSKMRLAGSYNRFRMAWALLLILTLTVSCSTVFFDSPQPTNSGNLKSVPDKIQGNWKNISKDYRESITIDKTSYHKVTLENIRLQKARAEASSIYKLRDGKIFLTDEDEKTGYPYDIRNDTLYFCHQIEESIVLSDSVLLRSAKDCFVLNLKKRNWWEIILIQKMKNGEIRISYPDPNSFMVMKDKYNISVLDSTRKDTTFYHAEFKSKGIAQVIPADGSTALYILKPDSTFTTPK